MSGVLPKPLWLLAELTYACPLQCPYCSNPLDFALTRGELTTAQWIDTLREARALGAAQLGFSGGEPLVRRDLEELVAEARALGYYTNLITSSVGMDAARVGRLREAGLDHIQVSFQASDAALGDYLAGTEAFAHKVEMARAVKAEGYPMVLNVVIHRHNIDRTDAILDLALDLGADYVELANTQYYGWAFHNRHRLLPTREQVRRSETVARRYRERHGDRMKILYVIPDYYAERPKPCMNGWGQVFLSVAPDGTATPCQGARMLPGLEFPKVTEHPAGLDLERVARLQPLPRHGLDAGALPELPGAREGLRRLPLPGIPRHRRRIAGGPGVRPVTGPGRDRPRGGSGERRSAARRRRASRAALPQPPQLEGAALTGHEPDVVNPGIEETPKQELRASREDLRVVGRYTTEMRSTSILGELFSVLAEISHRIASGQPAGRLSS